MRYITSVERIGMQQGLQQGLQQGATRQLLRALQHRFGPTPEEVRTKLEKLDIEQLEKLLDLALEVNSLAEFRIKIPSIAEIAAHPQ